MTDDKQATGGKKSAKSKPDKLDSNSINVKVYTPFKTYYDGPAKSISAENDTGPFDVLPRHHNFMTLLNPGEITVRKDDGEQKYRIARGVMHVRQNTVTVFLDV